MKLKGAKKAAFLRRMAQGRANAAKKGTKSATNKSKSNSSTVMQKTRRRTSRRQRFSSGIRRTRAGAGKFLSTAKPYVSGIGGGVAVEAGVSKLAPQYGQIAGYAGAYGFGGVKGVIGKVVFDLATGRGLPSIPSLGGGNNSGSGGFSL